MFRDKSVLIGTVHVVFHTCASSDVVTFCDCGKGLLKLAVCSFSSNFTLVYHSLEILASQQLGVTIFSVVQISDMCQNL
jgi:hypothetical protein